MRMALGTGDGEAVEVGKAKIMAQRKRRRLTDEQLVEIRRAWMTRLRDEGCEADEIGAIFGRSARTVFRELAAWKEGPDGGERRTA